MFNFLNKKTLATAAAVIISTSLLLTGCAGSPAPSSSSTSSSPKGALQELEAIANASNEKAAKSGFVENVKIGETEYTLVYNPKGTEGKAQNALKAYSPAAIDPDTGLLPATADENGREIKYLLDRGYDNFDPIVVKKYISGGSLFFNEGGSVVKNNDGTYSIKTPRQPDTIVTVKDGLIVGIAQTFKPSGSVEGAPDPVAQTLKSTIVYKLSQADLDLIQKAVDIATAEAAAAEKEAADQASGNVQ